MLKVGLILALGQRLVTRG